MDFTAILMDLSANFGALMAQFMSLSMYCCRAWIIIEAGNNQLARKYQLEANLEILEKIGHKSRQI